MPGGELYRSETDVGRSTGRSGTGGDCVLSDDDRSIPAFIGMNNDDNPYQSTSGSSRTVAAYRSPSKRISTSVPGSAYAGGR